MILLIVRQAMESLHFPPGAGCISRNTCYCCQSKNRRLHVLLTGIMMLTRPCIYHMRSRSKWSDGDTETMGCHFILFELDANIDPRFGSPELALSLYQSYGGSLFVFSLMRLRLQSGARTVSSWPISYHAERFRGADRLSHARSLWTTFRTSLGRNSHRSDLMLRDEDVSAFFLHYGREGLD